MVAALFGLRVLTKHLPQTPTLLWGGAMLVSFVGWGSAVNWLVWPKRVADWGLRAMWGVSATLFLGGILCALNVARTPMILVQTNLGIGLAAAFSIIHARAPSVRTWRVLVAAPGLALVLGAAYLAAWLWFYGNLGNTKFNESDDYILYWVLAKKILATGTMYEPFGARRILNLGGQDYLNAMYLVEAPVRFIHGLDRGVFMILTVALVVGAFTTDGLRARYVVPLGLAVLALFWVPDVLQNSASLYSGVAALLGVWRTLRWNQRESSAPQGWSMEPRRVALLGLSAVTCMILRSSNLLPVVTFLGLAIVLDYARVRRPLKSLTELAYALVILAFSAAITLLPWSLLMYQSCGTLLYPMWQGNLTKGFEMLHKTEKMGDFTSAFVGSVFNEHTLTSFIVLALAGMAPARGPGRNDGFALTVASLFGFVAITMMGAWFGPEHLPRYYFSYFVATAVALVMSAKSALGRSRSSQMARLAVVAGAVAAQVVAGRDAARTVYTGLVADMDRIWTGAQKELDDFDKNDADYKDMQAKIPQHAKVAVAVLEPFRFDFKRNEIDSLDTALGGMGPGGFPTFKGPEALASYLLSHGVRYLVFTDFNQFSFPYGKAHWQEHLKTEKSYLKDEATYQLDVIASIEALAHSRDVMHKSGPMTLLDLAKR